MRSYIEKFHYAMKQYLTALEGIVPVFNYMVGLVVSDFKL